jgi:hypothetical protein
MPKLNKVKKSKYQLNPIQAKNLAKYLLDLSKITFSLLVIGYVVSDKWIALQSPIWYSGIVLTTAFLILGMYFYRRRRK